METSQGIDVTQHPPADLKSLTHFLPAISYSPLLCPFRDLLLFIKNTLASSFQKCYCFQLKLPPPLPLLSSDCRLIQDVNLKN